MSRPIERVYVAGWRGDLRYTQCCVASIRRWYPNVPIRLVKDESGGEYDTSEIENHFGIEIFDAPRRRFGWGIGKLEVLWQPRRERCLVLDSDTVFTGRVLDRLEAFGEDFVVNGWGEPEDAEAHFFDLARLRRLDPGFRSERLAFNTGQLVATTGLLSRDDFAPFLTEEDPPRVRDSETFKCGEQGLLNYVVLRAAAAGALTLRHENFMQWAGWMPPRTIPVSSLGPDSPHPFVVHWAGPKRRLFAGMPNRRLLRHFECAYYARLPDGRRLRARRRIERLLGVIRDDLGRILARQPRKSSPEESAPARSR